MVDETKQHLLLKLYAIAVDEYRFQVNLNWERMKFYLSLNLILLGLGAGFLNLQEPSRYNPLIAAFFVAAMLCCILGVLAIQKSKRYYQLTIFKKTLVEDQLNLLERLRGYPSSLATLGLLTTDGMADAVSILQDTENWLTKRSARPGSVVFYVILLLATIALLDLGCACYVLFSHAPVRPLVQ